MDKPPNYCQNSHNQSYIKKNKFLHQRKIFNLSTYIFSSEANSCRTTKPVTNNDDRFSTMSSKINLKTLIVLREVWIEELMERDRSMFILRYRPTIQVLTYRMWPVPRKQQYCISECMLVWLLSVSVGRGDAGKHGSAKTTTGYHVGHIVALVTCHWSTAKKTIQTVVQRRRRVPATTCVTCWWVTVIKFGLVLSTRTDRAKNRERKSLMAENLPLGLRRVWRDGEEARRIRKKIYIKTKNR